METAVEQEGVVWSGGGLQLWDGGVVAAGAVAGGAIGGGATGSMSGLSPCRHASTWSVGEDRKSMSRRIETGCSVTRRVQVGSRCGFETRSEGCLSPSQLVAAQGQSMGSGRCSAGEVVLAGPARFEEVAARRGGGLVMVAGTASEEKVRLLC